MPEVNLKTSEEISVMAEGGRLLAEVKSLLRDALKVGANAWRIEELATREIVKRNGSPSFKMVPGYSWTTCINVNDGVVHGIPRKDIVFRDGDLLSVDLGMFYKGFHTDTSFSVLLGDDPEKMKFLKAGEEALSRAVESFRVGRPLRDISTAIEKTITRFGYSPVRSLVGHGIGRDLHEYPPVPCFVFDSAPEEIILREGLVLAIEVMYTLGSPSLVTDSDGWTIRTRDGKIASLIEETVALTAGGPLVLTA